MCRLATVAGARLTVGKRHVVESAKIRHGSMTRSAGPAGSRGWIPWRTLDPVLPPCTLDRVVERCYRMLSF